MTIYVVIVQLEIPQMPHNYYGTSAQIDQLYVWGIFEIFIIFLGRCHSWQVCVWQQNPSNFIGHFS